MKYTITVMLKPGMVDAQGTAVEEKLHSIGYNDFTNVRVGKVIKFDVDERPDSFTRVREVCSILLYNDIIEDYEIMVADE